MLNKFSISISMLLLTTLMSITALSENIKTATLSVKGMTCKFCPITVRKALTKTPGVIKAKADYESKTATVTYDADKTNTQALTKATANAGYPSTVKTQ